MKKNEYLAKLFEGLWLSADFESDFASDWAAVYDIMADGRGDTLDLAILKCCYKYLLDWNEKNQLLPN